MFVLHVFPLFHALSSLGSKWIVGECDRLAACPSCLPTFNPMHAGICSSAPLTTDRKRKVKNINGEEGVQAD